MTAAGDWKLWLERWAIPQVILDAAPESPWGFPKELFARRADAALKRLTPSNLQALERLEYGDSVLDVGCGAGSGSLPLVRKATRLIGVDQSEEMLLAFRARAESSTVSVQTICGIWPDVASSTPAAEVVVCHHVVYNVPDLAPFLAALLDHARRRVVLELTLSHPMSHLNDLWQRFHGLARPDRPTYQDALAVLREMGISPQYEEWSPEDELASYTSKEEIVTWTRRRLCLPAERDSEIADAIAQEPRGRAGIFGLPVGKIVTVWFDVPSA